MPLVNRLAESVCLTSCQWNLSKVSMASSRLVTRHSTSPQLTAVSSLRTNFIPHIVLFAPTRMFISIFAFAHGMWTVYLNVLATLSLVGTSSLLFRFWWSIALHICALESDAHAWRHCFVGSTANQSNRPNACEHWRKWLVPRSSLQLKTQLIVVLSNSLMYINYVT